MPYLCRFAPITSREAVIVNTVQLVSQYTSHKIGSLQQHTLPQNQPLHARLLFIISRGGVQSFKIGKSAVFSEPGGENGVKG